MILYLKCRVLPPNDNRWTEGLKSGSDQQQLQRARDARNSARTTPNDPIQSDLQETLELNSAQFHDVVLPVVGDTGELPISSKDVGNLDDGEGDSDEVLPEVADLIEEQVRRGVAWHDLGPFKEAVRKKYNKSSYNRALTQRLDDQSVQAFRENLLLQWQN